MSDAPSLAPPAEEPPRAPFLIALRRPPLLSPLIIGALVGSVLGMLLGIASSQLPRSWLVGAITGMALIVILGVRRALLPRTGATIEVGDTQLLLPRHAESRRLVTIPYAELLSLQVLGAGREQRLVVSARHRLLVYPLRAFAQPEAVNALIAAVHANVARTEGGDAQLAAMRERLALGQHVARAKPLVTYGLLVVLVAMFAYTLSEGALERAAVLLALGANAHTLVRAGQWFRLGSSSFLHASFLHILMNGMALLMVGSMLERLIGSSGLTIVYVVSAIAGSLASVWLAQAPLSVGASGAIFGLLGSLAVINWRFGGSLPAGYRLPARQWITLAVVNGALPLLVPQIDVGAHIGGLVAGALATLALCRGRAHAGGLGAHGAGVRLLAAMLMMLLVGSLVRALTRSEEARREDVARMLAVP